MIYWSVFHYIAVLFWIQLRHLEIRDTISGESQEWHANSQVVLLFSYTSFFTPRFAFIFFCHGMWTSKFGSLDLVTPSHNWDAHVFLLSAIFRWIHFGPWLDSYITLTKRVMLWMVGYSRRVGETRWTRFTHPSNHEFRGCHIFLQIHPTFNLYNQMCHESMHSMVSVGAEMTVYQIAKNDIYSIFKCLNVILPNFKYPRQNKIVNTYLITVSSHAFI